MTTDAAKMLTHPGVGREEFARNPYAIASACYRHGFEQYRRALLRSTEACDNFHFGVFATVAGNMVGRRAYLHHGRYMFPNFYTCLIGGTGATRKSTAIRYGLETANKAGREFETVATASWEGLLDVLGADGGSRCVLMNPGEFRTLACKAKQDSTSQIIPGLTEIYDCPPSIRHKTRGRDVEATRPFVCILTSSTPEWFRESFDENAVAGGFLNRWIFVDGNPKEPNPFPEFADTNAAIDVLREMDDWLNRAPDGRCLALSTEARDVWREYYLASLGQTPKTELLAKMGERLQDTALKLALLYACLEGTDEIRSDQLQAGILFAKWQRQAHGRVFEGFGDNKQKRCEDRILSKLERDGGAARRRDVQRNLGSKYSSEDFNRALAALLRAGRVEHEKDTGSLVLVAE